MKILLINFLICKLEQFEKDVTSTKEKAIDFLRDIGFLNKDGDLNTK